MRCGSRGTFAGHICCTAHRLGVHHALELCIYVEHKGCSMPLEFTFGTCVETTWRTWYQIQMRNHNPINSTWKRKLRHKNFGAHSSQHKYTIHTMASMTQATATGITATRHSSRKEKRDLLKGMQRVTTDPNNLIESDQEEGHQRIDSKQGHKDTYQNPPSLPSTI